ncbi:MAG: Na(+)/H(+) antiporter subunit D [Rhodospirillaceae bacterium]|nr:Na(+)/H(+) antiporter subunit D [Rhodospirillaceae bacterium]
MMPTELLSPGIFQMLAALLVPLIAAGLWRNVYMAGIPVVAFWWTLGLTPGDNLTVEIFDLTLIVMRIDDLSLIFAYIFQIATLISIVYAWHIRDTVQQVAGLIYSGAAIAAVFAGDLVTLFVMWELTALASVFLIWARRDAASFRAGMRYLVIQVGSGVLLLAGSIIHYQATGSIAFNFLGIGTLGTNLILLAFAVKCAFPLLHNWLQDSYGQATVTGTVFLSAFTTKLAVYALARGYPGTEMLIWIGATMTAFPIFYAVIENDLRRVLAYSLNNQLGFMVVGVGIGTEMALNGTAAHAFAHILYKALLFMSMGAVLFRTDTIKGSELGGLYKSMPWSTGFCIVGAASISAFPLTSGFVSKALIITAAAEEGHWIVWAVLLFASAGVFHHSGIKIPYFAFFAHDSGKRVKEAPINMLIAMAAASALCLGIGMFPDYLYAILPYQVNFIPYTTAHVITQLQLLMFSALAFTVLMWTRIYPPELRSINLDTDWVYRRLMPSICNKFIELVSTTYHAISRVAGIRAERAIRTSFHLTGPQSALARTWEIGSSALWVMILLAVCLVLYYV